MFTKKTRKRERRVLLINTLLGKRALLINILPGDDVDFCADSARFVLGI